MKDDITVLFSEGEGEWQEPVAADNVDMKAYIKWKTRWIKNQAGEMVLSKGMAYIIHSRLLTHKDKIKIDSVEYTVLQIEAGKDFSPNHQEIHFQ